MRVLLRADSGVEQGTGHVMRCLTLGEELQRRGHEVHLATRPIEIGWLRRVVDDSGVVLHSAQRGRLDIGQVSALRPDWLVIDSYQIPTSDISAAGGQTRVLAIVDGADQAIGATLYLNQNLGAEVQMPNDDEHFLNGSRYALVRQEVVRLRRKSPWKRQPPESVVCFMGGTDSFGTVAAVAGSISRLRRDINLTVVAPDHLHQAVSSVVTDPTHLILLSPTPALPALIAEADIVVSAAGTSAWDICTLGIPAVFVAVAENQSSSLSAAMSRGLALGINAIGRSSDKLINVGGMVGSLLDDMNLRRRLSDASLATFDGMGAGRVATRLESHPSYSPVEL